MDINSLYYRKEIESFSFLSSQTGQAISPFKDQNVQNMKSIDSAEISRTADVLNELGLELRDNSEIISNNTLKFNYFFKNESLNIKSSGNFNYESQSGAMNLLISFSRISGNEDGTNPGQIKIKLNFSYTEKSLKIEKGKETRKPNILDIMMKIIKKVVDITKEGQDKDIRLAFEDEETYLNFLSLTGSRLGRLFLQWLYMISKMHNINDEDGKRDKVILLIPDQDIEISYSNKEVSIKMSNIEVEFTLPLTTQRTENTVQSVA